MTRLARPGLRDSAAGLGAGESGDAGARTEGPDCDPRPLHDTARSSHSAATGPERLYCRCGLEVRVVKLVSSSLTLGHVQRPWPLHYVRLAPSSALDGSRSPRAERGATRESVPQASPSIGDSPENDAASERVVRRGPRVPPGLPPPRLREA